MGLMTLNVVFSGMGSGSLNMLAFIVIAVFLAGLMVGRSPEYPGKKLEARETKYAMIVPHAGGTCRIHSVIHLEGQPSVSSLRNEFHDR